MVVPKYVLYIIMVWHILSNASLRILGKTSFPGQCKDTKQCKAEFPSSYQCISVRSDRPNLVGLAQCTPDPQCGGIRSGLCPSFSSWKKLYRSVDTVCAITQPSNCRTDKSKPDDDVVDCFQIQINKNKVVGIYQCMDYKYFEDNQISYNYTASQLESCKSNNSVGVCNGHGTCGPVTDFSMEYKCHCYVGYDQEENCFGTTSNQCSLPGQCGENGECDVSAGLCDCEEGYTGNQCAFCDKAFPEKACNRRGTCLADGTCACAEGSNGTLCEIQFGRGSSSAASLQISGAAMVLFALLSLAL